MSFYSQSPNAVTTKLKDRKGANVLCLITTPLRFENSRDLITTVSNTFGTATISAFGYENDGLGRRTARVDTTPSLTVNNAFGYNFKSEVTSATMANGDSKYNYDPIGNRVFSSLNALTNTYSANALNQYSSLQPKDLQPINLSYDLDGNMLTNGIWSYSWDAENRLTAVYSNNTLLVSNIYDHQSRRIAKIVSHGGTETQRREFIYDDWNLIQETIHNSQLTITNSYTWGLDLSGTLQGAGGVGGLLAVTRGSATYFPCFDANGNVTEYIDATGAIKAHYAFDAFGNTISQSGDMASTFSHRFSTKYADDETGLYYYGYRYYAPELGRWVNRDPIGEDGSKDIYGFVANDSIDYFDILGNIKKQEPDPKPLPQLPPGECKNVSREEFEAWLIALIGKGLEKDQISDFLNNGCVGVTCVDKGIPGDPDSGNRNDSKCYLREEDARDKGCKRCGKDSLVGKPCCTVWAKQGIWNPKQGKKLADGSYPPPKENADGTVPCTAVKSAGTEKDKNNKKATDWNFILSKHGWYFYANAAKENVKEQRFYICKKLPEFEQYPAIIWGATCVKKTYVPEPNP
jgi:RHS repeat-associated protein